MGHTSILDDWRWVPPRPSSTDPFKPWAHTQMCEDKHSSRRGVPRIHIKHCSSDDETHSYSTPDNAVTCSDQQLSSQTCSDWASPKRCGSHPALHLLLREGRISQDGCAAGSPPSHRPFSPCVRGHVSNGADRPASPSCGPAATSSPKSGSSCGTPITLATAGSNGLHSAFFAEEMAANPWRCASGNGHHISLRRSIPVPAAASGPAPAATNVTNSPSSPLSVAASPPLTGGFASYAASPPVNNGGFATYVSTSAPCGSRLSHRHVSAGQLSPPARCGGCSSARGCSRQQPSRSPSHSRIITKSKQILSEAVDNMPSANIMDARLSKNTGVLAPLLELIATCGDTCKVRDYMDTVRYLAIDEANRCAVVELNAVGTIVGRMADAVAAAPLCVDALCAGLHTLAALSREEACKQQFWSGPGKGVLLTLLQQHGCCSAGGSSTAVVLAALHAIDHLAWSSDSSSSCSGGRRRSSHAPPQQQLMDSGIVPALAALLQPTADPDVLTAALDLLSAAALSTHSTPPREGGAPSWHKTIFSAVPLLVPNGRLGSEVVIAALELMLVLADRPPLRTTICAAGCLPPLLALLLEADGRLARKASYVLCCLVDSRMGRERLCDEGVLCVLLRVLQGKHPIETKIGALYILRTLAQHSPAAVSALRLHSAIPTLLRLLQLTDDEDAKLGASNLLSLLGSHVGGRPRVQHSYSHGHGHGHAAHRIHVHRQRTAGSSNGGSSLGLLVSKGRDVGAPCQVVLPEPALLDAYMRSATACQ